MSSGQQIPAPNESRESRSGSEHRRPSASDELPQTPKSILRKVSSGIEAARRAASADAPRTSKSASRKSSSANEMPQANSAEIPSTPQSVLRKPSSSGDPSRILTDDDAQTSRSTSCQSKEAAILRPATRWAVQPLSGIRWARQAPELQATKSVKFDVQPSLRAPEAFAKSSIKIASLDQLNLTDVESDDEEQAAREQRAAALRSTHQSAAFSSDTLATFATFGRWQGQYSSVAAKLKNVTTTSWEHTDVSLADYPQTDTEGWTPDGPAVSRSGASAKTADSWIREPTRESSGGLDAVIKTSSRIAKLKKRGTSRNSVRDSTTGADTLLVSNAWTDSAEQVKTAWNFRTGHWIRDEVKLRTKEVPGGGVEHDAHGGTWHPKLPVFFKDPRQRLTEALLNRDHKEMDEAFDQICLETRPGSEGGRPIRHYKKAGTQQPVEEIPEEFEAVEEEAVRVFGNNESGQLGTADTRVLTLPVRWGEETVDKYYLQRRIRIISLGWYHGVLVARRRWNMRSPPRLPLEAYQDEENYPTLAWATMLLDWATPDFLHNIREGGLPEDPELLCAQYPREQILSMYEKMLQVEKYPGVKTNDAVFTWGLNSSGQLGHEDKKERPILQPVIGLLGLKVQQVACGGFHTLLLVDPGVLLAFGANERGQLGLGDCTASAEPVCVAALTRSQHRGRFQASQPSNVLLVQNLEPYTSERDVREAFEVFFGFKKIVFINADYSTTDLGMGVVRPQVLVFFKDEVTASQARKTKNGGFLGGQHWDDRLKISFFHKGDAGKDLMAWLSTSQTRCILQKGTEIKQIVAGFDHSLALLSNGQVAGWGNNKLGQVGTQIKAGVDPELVLKIKQLRDGVGSYIEMLPVILPFTSDLAGEDKEHGHRVSFLAAGGNHSMFLTAQGKLMAAGSNDWGQLGLGPYGGKKQHGVVEVMEMAKEGMGDIRIVVCGASHTFCLLRDGRVFGCGRNDCAQLGIFSEMRAIKDFMAVEALKGLRVAQMATSEHTIAVCDDFQVRTFGNNTHGQLGAGDQADKTQPHKPGWAERGIRLDPLCGAFHSMVCTRLPLVTGIHAHTDCIFSWGYNKHGELGQGRATRAVQGKAVGHKVPTLIADLHAVDLEELVAGWYHAYAMVRNNGEREVYSWGYNKYGQLAQHHFESASRPVRIDCPGCWLPSHKIASISCGGFSTYFVTTDAQVWACGANSRGQLGVGTTRGRAKGPVRIKALSGKKVTSVACGFDHCFAIAKNVVYGFGGNQYGQLGLGTTVDVPRPEKVKAIDSSRLEMIACGGNHTVVLKPNQVLACGRNDFGQCGVAVRETILELTPVEILTVANPKRRVKFASCGASHSIFVLENGELLGCGRNDMGQLGLGQDTPMVSVPSLILPTDFLEGNRVKQVSCGEHTLVTLHDDAVIACGCNNNGQLGVGHLEDQFEFRQLPLDSRRAVIKAGAYHSFVSYSKKAAEQEKQEEPPPIPKPPEQTQKQQSRTCSTC